MRHQLDQMLLFSRFRPMMSFWPAYRRRPRHPEFQRRARPRLSSAQNEWQERPDTEDDVEKAGKRRIQPRG